MTPLQISLAESPSNGGAEKQPSLGNDQLAGLRETARDPKAASKEPPKTLEEARREILRLVCEGSVAMVAAVIKDGLQGRYLSVKFLFEMVGLTAIDGEEVEDAAGRESLGSLLLKRWQIVPQGGKVTEVSEVTSGVAEVGKAPVES